MRQYIVGTIDGCRHEIWADTLAFRGDGSLQFIHTEVSSTYCMGLFKADTWDYFYLVQYHKKTADVASLN